MSGSSGFRFAPVGSCVASAAQSVVRVCLSRRLPLQKSLAAAVAAGVCLIVGVSKMALDGPADIVVRDLTGITFDGEVLNIADSNRLR